MPMRQGGDRIVVGVDGSSGSLTAMRWALEEARLRGEPVEVVGTWTDPLALGGPGIPVGLGASLRKSARQAVRKSFDLARDDGGPDVEVREAVICGRPAHVLTEMSVDADMLVLGSRGLGGFKGLVLGSVSQQCAHHARCPLVIVPSAPEDIEKQAETERQAKIVVGIDGSAGSYVAMEWAVSEARRRSAVLDLVTAWHYPFGRHGTHIEEIRDEAEEILRDSEKEALEVDGSIPIEHRLVQAPPARGLLEASADADLLVVGSRGRGGFGGLLLGSVSQACAGHASCPVVLVRPGEE